MKTIKIIDLYNLIANEEFDKLPKKFTYKGYLWEYDVKNKMWFYYFGENKNHRFDRLFYINQILNDEIKILEEENQETKPITKKDFETLGYACGEIQKAFTNGWTKSLENKPLKEEKKIPKKLNIELNTNDENKVNYYRANNLECDLAFKINEILDYLESEGE